MGATSNLPGTINKPDGLSAHPTISPIPRLQRAHNLSTIPTLRTEATVLVRLHRDHKVATPSLPPEAHRAETLELQQLRH